MEIYVDFNKRNDKECGNTGKSDQKMSKLESYRPVLLGLTVAICA